MTIHEPATPDAVATVLLDAICIPLPGFHMADRDRLREFLVKALTEGLTQEELAGAGNALVRLAVGDDYSPLTTALTMAKKRSARLHVFR